VKAEEVHLDLRKRDGEPYSHSTEEILDVIDGIYNATQALPSAFKGKSALHTIGE
jgi:hypothetical protein